VLNIPVSQIILNEPGIRALAGQREAAPMPEHVGMSREGEGGNLAVVLEGHIDGRAVQGFAPLADEKAFAAWFEPGAFLELYGDCAQFVAVQGLRAR
jgi:hypothetical protein